MEEVSFGRSVRVRRIKFDGNSLLNPVSRAELNLPCLVLVNTQMLEFIEYHLHDFMENYRSVLTLDVWEILVVRVHHVG